MKKKILYVPLDERSCNYDFPQKLAAMTEDMELLEPPIHLMGFKKTPADPDALWQWVFEQAPQCQYAVISVDTMVYGNLINSRIHHKTWEQCRDLMENFRRLKAQNPKLKIHAFNLVARVAAYNSDAEDPDYWAQFGTQIWKYAYFRDKEERGLLSEAEKDVLSMLKTSIPAGILTDFLDRREVDRKVNLSCVDLVEEGVFDLLTVPKDDTAEFGYAAMDQRALASHVYEKQLMDRVLVYPGADEVGSVLFARVFNDIHNYTPRIYVRYSSTYGPFVIPLYEDRPLNESVKAQIHSLGGVMVSGADHSDCMLAVNSPGLHMTEASAQDSRDITCSTHANLAEFFASQRHYYQTQHKPVGMAEVSVANGCDNECMDMGRLTGAYSFLTAVGGWNTTANTVGVVLAQLVIASYYQGFQNMPEQLERSRRFMTEHLVADWIYQSNVLPKYLEKTRDTVDPYALDDHMGEAVADFRREIQNMIGQKFPNGLFGKPIRLENLEFQWNGVFYVRLSVA